MKIFGKILGKLFYAVFAVSFLWVSGQLFFEEQTNNLLVSVQNLILSKDVNSEADTDLLRVVYPTEPVNLEPTSLDPNARQVLINIYEPLVKPDRDLSIRPALALSWGMIDDLTWEFTLRPDVKFHDGSVFDGDDVLASFKRAENFDDSQLQNFLSGIKDVKMTNENTLRIVTKDPDPLLLQKISMVLIFPSQYAEDNNLPNIGTAPYKFSNRENGDRISLEFFADYWGKLPAFQNVEMIFRADKNERVAFLIDGEADFLAFVPQDMIAKAEKKGFEISAIPSLEVHFLLFNFNSSVFADISAREIFAQAIDKNYLAGELGEYVAPVSQFISSGIFGFNPEIESKYDLEAAKKKVDGSNFSKQMIQFHLPKGLDILGEHVRTQMQEIGINTIVSYLDPDKFMKSLSEGKADLYFFGYKSDLPDSVDFLQSVAFSKAPYNIGHFKNEEVDNLITKSLTNFDQKSRRDDLQKAMKIIVSEEKIGVPLFEYETVYAFNPDFEVAPRIDGMIYFDEITIN